MEPDEFVQEMRGHKNRRAFTQFEFAVVVVIICVFTGSALIFLDKAALKAREVTLDAQLRTLRMSLDFYKLLRGVYPDNLKTLVNASYKITASEDIFFGKEFLSTVGIGREGCPVDPFGKRFQYDPEKGLIKSAEKGYENR